jgi:hypothetical protein
LPMKSVLSADIRRVSLTDRDLLPPSFPCTTDNNFSPVEHTGACYQ